MVEKLRSAIQQTGVAADAVNSTAQDMSMTADQINDGATSQAPAAQQASAAMEEISANIRQGMENAVETESIAMNTANRATEKEARELYDVFPNRCAKIAARSSFLHMRGCTWRIIKMGAPSLKG